MPRRKTLSSFDEERIFQSLEGVIHAFFEAHDVAPQQKSAFLTTIANNVSKQLELTGPLTSRETKRSKIKIANQKDIQRMWANHSRAQRKKSDTVSS